MSTGDTEGQSTRRSSWTAKEDARLKQLVRAHGAANWSFIAQSLNSTPPRNGKSCRLRWFNQLNPKVKKGPFTVEEDQLIVMRHAKFGNRWATIAKSLPGRTDNAIKNYWNGHLYKRASSMLNHAGAARGAESLSNRFAESQACTCRALQVLAEVTMSASLQDSDAVLTREGLKGQSHSNTLTPLTGSFTPVQDSGEGSGEDVQLTSSQRVCVSASEGPLDIRWGCTQRRGRRHPRGPHTHPWGPHTLSHLQAWAAATSAEPVVCHSHVSPAQMSSTHAGPARLSQPLLPDPGSFARSLPITDAGQRLQQTGTHPISLHPMAEPGPAKCSAMQPSTGLNNGSSMTGLSNQPIGQPHQCMEMQQMSASRLHMADQHSKPSSFGFAAFAGDAEEHRWPCHELHSKQDSAQCEQALCNTPQQDSVVCSATLDVETAVASAAHSVPPADLAGKCGNAGGKGSSLMHKALDNMLQARRQSSPLAGPAIADSIMAYLPGQAKGMPGKFSELGACNDQSGNAADDSLAHEHCPDNLSFGHGLSSHVPEYAAMGSAATQHKAEKPARRGQLSAGQSKHMKDLPAAQQLCCSKADNGWSPGIPACTM